MLKKWDFPHPGIVIGTITYKILSWFTIEIKDLF